jgi:hypothetical protein
VTREEAIRKVTATGYAGFRADHLIGALESLGLLKLDTIDDATFRAASERLKNVSVCINPINTSGFQVGQARLSEAGAYEVLDVLRKAGFKITGPERCRGGQNEHFKSGLSSSSRPNPIRVAGCGWADTRQKDTDDLIECKRTDFLGRL